MAPQERVDVVALVSRQKLNRFHLGIVALAFATLFVDGMDFASVIVASPAIVGDWKLDRSAMGVVFGAGNFGLFLGAVLFGWLGDRRGRRIGLIAGVLTYTLPALATSLAGSVNTLLALRVLAALGIGGVLPNAIAFLNETAPARFRSSFVIVALIGTSLGAAAAGGVGASLMVSHGWQSMFVVVGILGLAVAALLYFAQPESPPFLALADPRAPQLKRLLNRLAPTTTIDLNAAFFVDAPKRERVALRRLFEGRLRVITPLWWAAYFAEGLTFITLISWTPLLLGAAGIAPALASLAFGYGAGSGVVTRLILGPALDRFGATALLGAALVALTAFMYLGSIPASPTMTIVAIVTATAFATATHDGLNAMVGSYYTTDMRANGVGWASGSGRLAAVVGPVAVGYMLSAQWPFAEMMYAIGLPYLFLFAIVLGLARSAAVESQAVRVVPR